MKRSIGIEEVFDVNDPDLWFFFLHGFNNYDLSSPIKYDIYDRKGNLIYKAGSSIVRSTKSVHSYPYGVLIIPRKRSNLNDPTFELTNNNNERVSIRLSQLVCIARDLPYAVSSYPRRANMVNPTCRNDRVFVNKKPKLPPQDNTVRFYPKFHIIEDDTSVLSKNPNMTPIPNQIKVPIESIDGSEYFGRKDIIIEWNES